MVLIECLIKKEKGTMCSVKRPYFRDAAIILYFVRS